MLGPDLVRAQRRGDELKLTRMNDKGRARAVAIAAELIGAARMARGEAREAVLGELTAIAEGMKERKLAAGLGKLIEGHCDFGSDLDLDPVEVRERVFRTASAARQAATSEAPFDRGAVLAAVASELTRERLAVDAELTRGGDGRIYQADDVDRSLFADLKGAQELRQVAPLSPEGLVAEYEQAQVQAVLLRAVKVTATVRCATPGATRELFRKLKFRRLLYRLEALGGGRYRIEIDGPFSLFEASTKYGLQLALMLPTLEACDELSLAAELRWGKERDRLTFKYERTTPTHRADEAAPPLPDAVAQLLEGLKKQPGGWLAEPATAVLDLPGVGLCVPDLVLSHPKAKEPVHVEVLGYWSREAVWRRVELVEQGLVERVLFAVSTRLRVSEQVLDGEDRGALYVYKGVMSARAVLQKVKALAGM